MRLRRPTPTRQGRAMTGLVAGVVAVLALSACTGSAEDAENDADTRHDAPAAAAGSNDEAGDTVTIGFSAPAADHGWMAAITNNVRDLAEEYPDIDLQIAEGTNDVNLQISQVETFINDGVDAIVLLPFDGAAMTPIALEAMEAGIPVINVDREFDDPNAARVTVLGDNYGMGVSAGPVHVRAVRRQPRRRHRRDRRASTRCPLTQDRSQGFEDALVECGLEVSNRVAADFTVEGGEEAAANLLQAAPKIDGLWNHDDDQGVGVLAAIENAGRDEFVMVGGAGSANAMRDDPETTTVSSRPRSSTPRPRAPTASSSRGSLLQGKAMSDLVEVEVPAHWCSSTHRS